MPELPEVETIARALRPLIVGRRIIGADVRWRRTIAAPSVRAFRREIDGQEICEIGRRAKLLHIRLSTSHLFVHLRMSGDLQFRPGAVQPQKHDRLILLLSDPGAKLPGTRGRISKPSASLAFHDTRKFGRVWLTASPESLTQHLGPEPLSKTFTAESLHAGLHRHRRQLKPLLLDQTFLGGLGNIYTDESLHMAKLHPLKSSGTVTRPQAQRLHFAIRSVLREAIRRNGSSIDWVYRGGEFQNQFRVYDRRAEPCPVCGTRIHRIVVAQRGTHICPRCQRI